jgi:hypothetical protein
MHMKEVMGQATLTFNERRTLATNVNTRRIARIKERAQRNGSDSKEHSQKPPGDELVEVGSHAASPNHSSL